MSAPEPPWTARTGTTPGETLVAYGECTDTDEALVQADLAGSIAHVVGLHEAGLLTEEEATTLVEGLQTLAEQAAEGELALDPALEDVHMNVEHQLPDNLGPVADKLHTARSRNDQVALDLTLVTREGLAHLAGATHGLAASLAEAVGEHLATPWPLHTHGLPAQPATLGYLLHAHALRLARAVDHQLAAFERLGESPLGAAAGAGTTLPTDPSVPADLLGLDPPTNGLLATGTRDGSIQAAGAAAQLGRHAQDLACDLVDLAGQGAVELAPEHTTGSSIMPHKANPDALELARADGTTLAHLARQVEDLATGQGLGYDRDLQRAKPPLLEALTLAPTVAGVLADVVDGLTVHEDALAAKQDTPGVATTDTVEALVHHGVAFRQAHQAVSTACHHAAAKDGASIEDALHEADLPEEALEAALQALDADPARRDTPAGPAPEQVEQALEALQADLDALELRVDAAREAAQAPVALLEDAPESLIETPARLIP